MSEFDPFGASAAAEVTLDEEAENEKVVLQVLNALPDTTRHVGRRGNGPGNIEAVLGYDPNSGSVRLVPEDDLEGFIYGKHGIMVATNLMGGTILALAVSLNKVPDSQSMLIIAAVVYATLQLALKGFISLTRMQQAACQCECLSSCLSTQ